MSKYSNDHVYVFLTGPEGVRFIRYMRACHESVWDDGPEGIALYSKEGKLIAQWADIDRSKPSDNRLVKDHMLVVRASVVERHMASMMPTTKETLAYSTTGRRR